MAQHQDLRATMLMRLNRAEEELQEAEGKHGEAKSVYDKGCELREELKRDLKKWFDWYTPEEKAMQAFMARKVGFEESTNEFDLQEMEGRFAVMANLFRAVLETSRALQRVRDRLAGLAEREREHGKSALLLRLEVRRLKTLLHTALHFAECEAPLGV
jgi:putative sterol carrier protein